FQQAPNGCRHVLQSARRKQHVAAARGPDLVYEPESRGALPLRDLRALLRDLGDFHDGPGSVRGQASHTAVAVVGETYRAADVHQRITLAKQLAEPEEDRISGRHDPVDLIQPQ